MILCAASFRFYFEDGAMACVGADHAGARTKAFRTRDHIVFAGITRRGYAVVVRGKSPNNTRRARSYINTSLIWNWSHSTITIEG
jgi:hypothetical protein